MCTIVWRRNNSRLCSLQHVPVQAILACCNIRSVMFAQAELKVSSMVGSNFNSNRERCAFYISPYNNTSAINSTTLVSSGLPTKQFNIVNCLTLSLRYTLYHFYMHSIFTLSTFHVHYCYFLVVVDSGGWW